MYEASVSALSAQQQIVDTLRDQYYAAFAEFKETMRDPSIVLQQLGRESKKPVARFGYHHISFLATLFGWNSKLNFSCIDTAEKSLSEWLDLFVAEAAKGPIASGSGSSLREAGAPAEMPDLEPESVDDSSVLFGGAVEEEEPDQLAGTNEPDT